MYIKIRVKLGKEKTTTTKKTRSEQEWNEDNISCGKMDIFTTRESLNAKVSVRL